MFECRIDDCSPHRRHIDLDRSKRRIAPGNHRVEIELVRFERRMPIEIVGERLPQVFLDCSRKYDCLAQHLARRYRHNHARRRRTAAIDHRYQRGQRGAARSIGDGSIPGEWNRCRLFHHGSTLIEDGTKQCRDIAVEHQQRTHPATGQRSTRHRRHQRIELRGPPGPESGKTQPLCNFAQARRQGRQGHLTVGHWIRFLCEVGRAGYGVTATGTGWVSP